MSFRRMLVPVDFSDRSIHALDYAVGWGRLFGAAIDVLHVWEPPAYVAPDMMVGLSEEAGHRTIAELARSEISREMKGLLDDLERSEGLEVRGHLEVGPVADTIIERANSGDYDLVIMATHGRRGISRLVLGSVAEQVVRRAHCPVLTLRPPEGGGAKQSDKRGGKGTT